MIIMQRLKNDNIPKILTELIKKPKHKNLTKFSKGVTPQNHSLSTK